MTEKYFSIVNVNTSSSSLMLKNGAASLISSSDTVGRGGGGRRGVHSRGRSFEWAFKQGGVY